MRCIAAAASDALTVTAWTTAFRRVGMWPLDPTVVTGEELSKGADAPVTSVDLEKLTRRLIPSVRKNMTCARVVNGTLSTAGRGTVLTALDILAALEGEAAAKAAARKANEAGKRAREAKAEERKLLAAQVERAKSAKMRAVKAAARREMWAELAFDAAREGASRMRAMGMLGPSASKLRRRAAAASAFTAHFEACGCFAGRPGGLGQVAKNSFLSTCPFTLAPWQPLVGWESFRPTAVFLTATISLHAPYPGSSWRHLPLTRLMQRCQTM